MREAALHDHAVAVAELGMTRRAVDTEPLLATLQKRERKRGRWLGFVLPCDAVTRLMNGV